MYGPSIKMCNCAECGRECLGESNLSWWYKMAEKEKVYHPIVAGRINGRPYCNLCVNTRPIPNRPGPKNDTSPSQENAIKALEGG